MSKAGNPRLRTSLIQLAWLWVRHQPASAITIWFKERVAQNGGRLKKTTIVALARKLFVALWKYVNAGVVIEGAIAQSTRARELKDLVADQVQSPALAQHAIL